jgi:hypothetical protein
MDKITKGLGALTVACLLAVGFWSYYREDDTRAPKIGAVEQAGPAADRSASLTSR